MRTSYARNSSMNGASAPPEGQEKQQAEPSGPASGSTAFAPVRKPGDYASDCDVRWCPGCGDYAVLSQVKKVLSAANADPDKIVFVSGIGCSSRFPYYMGTYGIHGIHGRALAIATGLKLTRPDLSVWVATGDGDALSIGGNHLIHAVRRNVDLKVILFNNRIYGLTKGQASPTSQMGQVTASTPYGVVEPPFRPLSVVLGCEATFVARAVDMIPKHLETVLERAAAHKGTAFVEVYQNCKIFNDGAFDFATDRAKRDDNVLFLEHGKPMIFGKNRNKAIRLGRNLKPEIVKIGQDGVAEADILIHDEKAPSPVLAFLLSHLHYPEFPDPVGVFRDVEAPTFDSLVDRQIQDVCARKGKPDLQSLLTGPDAWTVG